MRKIRIRSQVLSRLLQFGLVLALSTWGFIGQKAAPDAILLRGDLLGAMAQVGNALENQIPSEVRPEANLPLHWTDLSSSDLKESQAILSAGVMAGFPDGSFRPAHSMTLVELRFAWNRLMRHLWERYPRCQPPEAGAVTTGLAVPGEEALLWLDLPATACIPLEHQSEPARQAQLRELMHLTMEYFTRTQIGLIPRDQGVEVWFKSPSGAEETDDRWEFRLDDGNWVNLGPDRRVDFAGGLPRTITARHPDFEDITIDMPRDTPRPLLASLKSRHRQDNAGSPANSSPVLAKAISGRVLDALSRQPVPGAGVVLGNRFVRTAGNGAFSLAWESRSGYPELFVTADGYQNLRYKPGNPGNGPLEILLSPFRTQLKGTVVSSATGLPVPGAEVVLGEETCRTDQAGSFTTRKTAPGYHHLEMRADGFQPARELIFLEEEPVTRVLKLHPLYAETR